MRGIFGWTAGLAGAMALTFVAGSCAKAKKEVPHAAGVVWDTTMTSALADASKNKRPIVLDFYTEW